MNIKIKLNNKKINLNVKKSGFLGKFRGLMFRSLEKSSILLFDNVNNVAIHSFFVFFPFLVLWLDEKNTIVEWKIVKPFSLYEKSNNHFSKIIEIPLNRRYHFIVDVIVGERFKKRRHL
jgi:uncharacterized membrane protein (UPF0127 family)